MSVIQNAKLFLAFNKFTKEIRKDQPMQYLGTILALVTTVSSLFAPQISGFMSAHPTIVGSVASVIVVINHFLPSPVSSK